MNFINYLNQNIEKSNKWEQKSQKLSFKGAREDHELVAELVKNNGAIIKPKERKLKEAINRFSQDSSVKNIEFLLSTAENLKYGVKSGSDLHKFLKTNSNLGTNVQNNNWYGLLVSAAHKAIEKNPYEAEREALTKKLDAILTKTSDPKEKELIESRNKILKSVEDLSKIESPNNKRILKDKASIKRNIDYFMASSECDISEKTECLKLLAHFATAGYQINPQLKDKKTQVLAEVLNDLVVKTPENSMMTIKQTNQRQHGMCAAISQCRKILPHEYKLTFVSTVLSELDNKPTMEVQNITDPDKTAKTQAKKAIVDFDRALRMNYRILDAAATNWMNIADSTGDGEAQIGKFTPFDKENYGMFHDSHWVADMPEKLQSKQKLLRASIKLKGLIGSIEAKDAKNKALAANSKKIEDDLVKTSQDAHEIAEKALKGLLPEEKDKNIVRILAIKLLNPAKVENKELKIDAKEDEIVKKQKLTSIIKAEVSNLPENKLEKAVDEIYMAHEFLAEAKANKAKLDNLSSSKSKIADYKNLFELAAYYRVKKEFELDVPEKLEALVKANKLENITDPQKQKEILLEKMEKGNLVLEKSEKDVPAKILPRKTLDALQNKFDEIADFADKKQKAKREGRKISDNGVYKFSNEQKEIFKKIEIDFSGIRKENIRDYKALNKELGPELSRLYNIYGQSKGNFWAGEEGGSGLIPRDQTRIYSQMTGNSCHIEKDPSKAMDHLQSGKSLGILNSMVSDQQVSGHAQCIYDVDSASTIDPETKKAGKERVLYLDNTWGPGEFDHTWKDAAGNLRTDYDRDFGYKQGFFVRSEGIEGVAEKDFVSGVCADKGRNIEYPLFMDVLLNGTVVDIDKNTGSLILSMTDKAQFKTKVGYVLENLMKGNFEKIEKLNKSLTAGIVLSSLNAVNENNLDGLKDSLKKQIFDKTVDYEDQMFKRGGKDLLAESISERINNSVKNIMRSEQSEDLKKIEISTETEKIIQEEIALNTAIGKKFDLNKFKNAQVQAKTLNKMFVSLINGADIDENRRLGLEKGIKSREDFDKIPEDHILKIALKKSSMLKYSGSSFATYSSVLTAKTSEDFDKAQKTIVSDRKDQFKSFFNKDQKSVNEIVDKFQKAILGSINELEKEEKINISAIKDINIIEKKAVEIIEKDSNGSIKDLEDKLNKLKEFMINSYAATPGAKEELSAKLKVKLENSISNCIKDSTKAQSIDDLEKTDMGRTILGWIDKKYSPKTNEELMKVYKDLHESDADSFNKVLDSSNSEELGIIYDDSYSIVQKARGKNPKALEGISNIAAQLASSDVFNLSGMSQKDKEIIQKVEKQAEWIKSPEAKKLTKEERIKTIEQNKKDFCNTDYGMNTIVMNLNSKLSYVGLEKMVNSQRQMAFDKYGARPTLPTIKVLSGKQKMEIITKNIDILGGTVLEISNLMKEKKKCADKDKSAQIDNQINELKAGLKQNTEVFVKSFVRPEQRDKTKEDLKEWYKSIRINPESKESQGLCEGLIKSFVNNCIVDYPEEFLKEIINTLPEMDFKNPQNAKIQENWINNLVGMMDASSKCAIEFGLMKEIGEGKLPQITQQLKSKDATLLVDTQTNEPMPINSKKGIELVLGTLQDSANNNKTLKFFLQQTGMVKDAVSYYLEGPSPQKHLQHIKGYVSKLEKRNNDQNIINNVFESHINQINKEESLDEAVKSYFGKLDETFVNKDMPDSSILDEYKKQIQEALEASKMMNQPQELSLLTKWHEDIAASQDNYADEVIERAIANINILARKFNGISNLEELLPENSEFKDKCAIYKTEVKKAVEELNTIRETLQNPLSDKIMEKQNKAKAEAEKISATSVNVLKENPEKNAKDILESLKKAVLSNDSQKLQVLLNEIPKSDNKLLMKELGNILFDKNSDGLLRTMAAGLLVQKADYEPLIKYAEDAVKNNGKLDKNVQDDQPLILVATGLTKGITAADKNVKNQCLYALTKLFKASTQEEAKTQIADQLAQAFMVDLPKKGNAVFGMLSGILNDKTADIATRGTSVYIMGNTNPILAFSVFQDLVINPDKFADKSSDKLYLLDAATNSISTITKEFADLDKSKVKKALIATNLNELLAQASLEGLNEEKSKDLIQIVARVKERINELN